MVVQDEDARTGGAVTEDSATLATVTDSRVGYVAEGDAHGELAPGTHVDRYVIEARIGAGGMGVVYAARDPDLDRRVAIKLLGARTGSWARLRREGQAVARLRHPSVVSIYDVGAHARGELFIAMELVDGGNLRQWLARAPRGWREIVALFAQAGRGLAAAHAAGLVHRDFKPDNVLVGDDGRVVVTDFGLARPRGDAGGPLTAGDLEVTRTGELAGTPAYMAPEQLTGAAAITASADQFSFCVALWEALYGARPYARRARTVAELREAMIGGRIDEPAVRATPARVHRAIRRGLAIDPAARHPSMEALLAAIEPRRARGWITLGAAAAIAGAAATFAAGRGEHAGASAGVDPCASAIARFDAIAAHPAGAAGEDVAALDRFAVRWRTLRRAACARGADRAALCLDLAAQAYGRAIARSDASRWPALPSLARCGGDAPDVAPAVHALGFYPGDDDALVLAPDGRAIARTEHGRLHLAALDGKDRAVLALRAPATDLRWTADGRLLVTDAQGVASIDRATGTITPVGPPAPGSVLSPDGATLAEVRGDAIWLAPTDGGPAHRLAPIGGDPLGGAWAPGGARFAVTVHPPAQAPRVRVIDVATGAYRDVAIRAARPLTREPIPFAFLDDHRLVLDGDQDDDHGQGVWIVELDDDAEPPEARLEAPPGTAYTIYDAAAGRAIALRHVVHDHFGRLAAGALAPIAGIGDGMVLVGIDRAGARLLISRASHDGSPFGWMSLADASVTPVAAPPGGATPVVRGDALDVIAGAPGAWRIDELGAGGDWHPRAALAIASDAAPRLACGPAPAERCVLVWHDHAWEVAALDDALRPGAPIAVRERAAITISVSPDGAQVALGDVEDAVTVVDLAAGVARDWPGVPGCYHQYTAWSRAGAGLYVGLICARADDSYRLARLAPGRAPETLYHGRSWVGPPALGPADELYVNLRAFDEDFVLIDGL